MRDPISPKQQIALNVIDSWQTTYDFPPSLQEIATKMGIAKPSAQSHVEKLIRKGVLRRVEGRLMRAKTTNGDKIAVLKDSAPRSVKRTTGEGDRNPHKINVSIGDKAVVVSLGNQTIQVRVVDGKLVPTFHKNK